MVKIKAAVLKQGQSPGDQEGQAPSATTLDMNPTSAPRRCKRMPQHKLGAGRDAAPGIWSRHNAIQPLRGTRCSLRAGLCLQCKQ